MERDRGILFCKVALFYGECMFIYSCQMVSRVFIKILIVKTQGHLPKVVFMVLPTSLSFIPLFISHRIQHSLYIIPFRMIRLHYNFYYQMKNPKKIIDSVSASELLKALSALQQMGEEGEISFSEDSKARPQGKGHSKVINFENYMARKTEAKPSKPQGQQAHGQGHFHTPAQQRKSISPIRDSHPEHTLKIADMKSRSCSPLTKKPEKTDRSMLVTQKRQQPPQQAPAKSFHAPTRHARENKQNKREEPAQSDKLYRASFQSKRILDQKQRKGAAAYVPIQLRTEELLREKQAKLARLQKQQEMNSILREKECTFKPNIIKTYKKPKRDDPPLFQPAPPQQDTLDNIQQESVRFDQQAQNEFLCTPTHPMQPLQSLHEPSQYLFPVEQPEPKPVRKYKNEKFNMLLDLIH